VAHSALYFPYIEVPDRPDLLRVLLYWDTLGTIVPEGHPASRRLRKLISAGLVTPVSPDDYEYSAADVLEAITSFPESIRAESWVRLHRTKANSFVWFALKHRGLVKRVDRDWMAVPASIAAVYMAGLATAIGAAIDAAPVTDQRSSFEPVVDQSGSVGRGTLRDRLRAVVLSDVLPAPIEALDPLVVARFKDRHWDLLHAFRLHIERRLLDCARERDDAYREELVRQIREELQYELIEIESKLSERGWATSRGLFAAAIPSAVAKSSPKAWCRRSSVAMGCSGRLELGHSFLDLIQRGLLRVGEDKRDRLG